MTTYEKLRSRIVELVPDIKKLEFGCEFKDSLGGKGKVISFTDFVDPELPFDIHFSMDDNLTELETGASKWFCEEMKIIGRPITYEDIVVAIKRRCGVPDKEHADLMQTAAGASCLAVGNRWQWQKPLEQQDEETLLFIDKILEV